MLHQRDLVTRPAQKPKLLQPDCPIYLHAYVCTVTKQDLAACVQMRFVNRSEQTVDSLFLRVRGIDAHGNTSFEQNDVSLAACHAAPHSMFGEEHALFLPRRFAEALEITVERVLFEDGMIWRRMPSHLLVTAEEAGWIDCECGMKNPSDAMRCAFCAKPVIPCMEEAPATEAVAEESLEEIAYTPAETVSEASENVEEIFEEAEDIPAEIPQEEMPEEAIEPFSPLEETDPLELPVLASVPEENAAEAETETIAEEDVETAPETEIAPALEAETEPVVEAEPEPISEVQDMSSEQPVCEAEIVSPEEPVCDLAQCEQIMSETATLLREIMARSAAAKAQAVPTPEPTEKTEEISIAPTVEEPQRKSKTLHTIFWVLAVLAVIAVALLFYFNPNGLLY